MGAEADISNVFQSDCVRGSVARKILYFKYFKRIFKESDYFQARSSRRLNDNTKINYVNNPFSLFT
jgi:hypothetical protein